MGPVRKTEGRPAKTGSFGERGEERAFVQPEPALFTGAAKEPTRHDGEDQQTHEAGHDDPQRQTFHCRGYGRWLSEAGSNGWSSVGRPRLPTFQVVTKPATSPKRLILRIAWSAR